MTSIDFMFYEKEVSQYTKPFVFHLLKKVSCFDKNLKTFTVFKNTVHQISFLFFSKKKERKIPNNVEYFLIASFSIYCQKY